MCEHRITLVTSPFLHVVGQSYAYALTLDTCLRIDASCIIVHHKRRAECLCFILIYGAFILSQSLPPLGILIIDRQDGTVKALPFVS